MKKTSTTTLVALLTLIACFGMLVLVLLGVSKSNVSTTTQIVQLITQLIPIVLLFYFGASHRQTKNSPQNPKTKMKQVFWDLTDIGTQIIKINGESIEPIAANDIPNIDSRFEVVLDDTDQQVLVVATTSTVTITTSNSILIPSAAADFASGRPTRPK